MKLISKRAQVFLLTLLTVVTLTGCADLLLKTATMVGGLNTQTETNLNDTDVSVSAGTNLYPKSLGTVSQSLFNDWVEGGDQFSIWFTRKSTLGFVKLDGQVTLDGKPFDYGLAGMYVLVTPAASGPRKVEIAMTSGQKASFVIEAPKEKIKLLSINGQKDGDISLDLTKDVTLELDVPASVKGKLIKATIAISQIGLKENTDIAYFKAASKVVIPASAFRNIRLEPASTALYSFKNSFFSVGIEGFSKATDVQGPFGTITYNTYSPDGKFVTVTNEPKINTGLVYKGEDTTRNMKYDFFKPGAFYSRPFSQLKTVGLKSFSIRGTTYSQSTSVTESLNYITTTTTTLVFPKQPDAVWDALMEKLYPVFVNVLQSELNVKVLPVETVTNSEAYKSAKGLAKDDANTKVSFARAFRGTKVISAFMPITEGFGPNGTDEKIMQQTGANALLSMTIDLQISSDEKSKLVLMVPHFGIQLMGKTNGPLQMTKYFNGTVNSITGVSFKTDIDMAGLEKIIRQSDMVAVLRKGLQELREQEKANGDYAPFWALQD